MGPHIASLFILVSDAVGRAAVGTGAGYSLPTLNVLPPFLPLLPSPSFFVGPSLHLFPAVASIPQDTGPLHRVEAAAAAAAAVAPSAVVQETIATDCSNNEGAGHAEGVRDAAVAVVQDKDKEMTAIDRSNGEEEGSDNDNDNDDGNDDPVAKADNKSDKFDTDLLVRTPSLGSDLRAKVVANVSFAFSAFAGEGNARGAEMVSAAGVFP